MAPRPKYIEGIEGVHPCPPVNSAILALIVPFENELALPLIKRVNRGKISWRTNCFSRWKDGKKKMPMLYRQLYGNVTKK